MFFDNAEHSKAFKETKKVSQENLNYTTEVQYEIMEYLILKIKGFSVTL